MKPFSSITIDSRKINKSVLKELEDVLYGTDTKDPRLPPLDEIMKIVSRSVFHDKLLEIMIEVGNWLWNPFDFRNDTIETAIKKWANESVIFVPEGTKPEGPLNIPRIEYWLVEYNSEGKNTYYIETVGNEKASDIMDKGLRELGAKSTGSSSAMGDRFEEAYTLTY